jgi:photosystem II stability/assembly factor-like uncharacterized protein
MGLVVCVLWIYPQDTSAQIPDAKKGNAIFGDMQARQIGPAIMSGRISDIELHPTNPRVIWVGTAGGGVWKSSNGGATFTPVFDDYIQSIGVVAVDPHNPDNSIWVGTGETWTRNSVSGGDGLYHSIDGGVNWKHMGFSKSDRISSIEVHPDDPNTVFVGILGPLWGDGNERGVYKTTDGGQTWEQLLYIDETTGCSDLIMDPQNPNNLYASFWEFRRTGWSFSSGGNQSALYKSVDGGNNWEKIHNGFPEGQLGRIAITVAPSDANILYSVLETEKEEDKGLYRSDDAGKSWKHLNNDFGLVVRPFYFSRIVVDPKNPDIVVKAGLTGSISRDGGNTFKNMGAMHSDIHDIAFHINDSDRIYAATDGGLYRSSDGASTMEIVSNLPVSQFYHVTVDNAEPYNIYGGLQDNGSWYGPSSSPGGIEARDWDVVGQGDGFRVYPHPTKPIIYSEMQGAENIWRFNTKTRSLKTIQPLPEKEDQELRFNWNAPITTSHHKPDRIFVGSQFVHLSDDMGDNWKIISPDLTTNDPMKQQQEKSGGLSMDNSGAENHTTIFTIAESPLDENIIWVGTDDGNVQLTTDGGKTWTNTVSNIKGMPANRWCHHIEASSHSPGTAYAVFDGHTYNDWNPYVYKTTDFGKTWTSIASIDQIYGFTRSIQEDYVNPDLLFLGTETGLYITLNGGNEWVPFTNNMPRVAVHHIEMQPKTNDLILATHGRGVIVIDDISPLRALTEEVMTQSVYFFDSEPSVISEESGFGGTATELEFVGPNPISDAKITYWLAKRHTFGKMTMEIQDMNGNKLLDLNPGKSKGLNMVTWNYLTRQPKVASGKTITFGGFTSPRVQAGSYKVVMQKGRDKYEHTIEVMNDPKSEITREERLLNHEQTMKLFNMSEDLAYLVYQIDEWTKATAALSEAGKISKADKKLHEKLVDMKKSLVITTGDNYVGAAKPELREKLATLYAKIASGFTPASVSELANLSVLEDRLNSALNSFGKLKDKELKKLPSSLEKAGLKSPEIMDKAAYLES